MAASLPSSEMDSFLARHGNEGKSWLGEALDSDRDGHLAVMEHKAGIEQVTGHRLGSGRKFRLGY